jgi:hypothetical protein
MRSKLSSPRPQPLIRGRCSRRARRLGANQIGRQRRQAVDLILGTAELVIIAETARMLGLTVPDKLLAIADG